MEQLAVVIFILGLLFIAEKTGNPLYNLIVAGFAFYLAFTVTAPALMILLVIFALFQLVYMYKKIK